MELSADFLPLGRGSVTTDVATLNFACFYNVTTLDN